MSTVTSSDGTRIAFERTGDGPPVVYVGGAFNDRSAGAPLAALLAPQFTVYTYDRRGRGGSGDTATGDVSKGAFRTLNVLKAPLVARAEAGCVMKVPFETLSVSKGTFMTSRTAAPPPFDCAGWFYVGGGGPTLAGESGQLVLPQVPDKRATARDPTSNQPTHPWDQPLACNESPLPDTLRC